MSRFSLMDDPWVPVLRHDGNVDLLGLVAVLTGAREIRDLACSSPIEHVAMLRLLLAICHRAMPVRQPADSVARFRGTWPSSDLRAYLECHRQRFDLLGGDAPFLQMPWLENHAKVSTYPIAKIVAEWATGNEKALCSHHDDEHPRSLDCASAARALVTHQQFALGGLSRVLRTSAKGAPGTGFAHCWVVGESLAQTLVLAQIAIPSKTAAADLPVWERPVPTEADVRSEQPYPAGPSSRYTWASRAILLAPAHRGRVDRVRWAEGLEYSEPDNAMDPMECRRPGTKGMVSFHFSDSKALWRNFHAMTTNQGQPASTLVYAAGVLRGAGAPQRRPVRSAGLLADKAKALFWREEVHTIPVDIAVNPARATAVVQMISIAEDCGRALDKALFTLAKARLGHPRTKPSPDAVKALASSLPGAQVFWSSLEPAFAEGMLHLADAVLPDDVFGDWRSVCREDLRKAWASSIDALGQRGPALAAAGAADAAFAAAMSLCKTEETMA